MHARDRGHDGQAQAVVAIGLAAGCVRAIEAVKQPGQMFGGNGLTLVLHRQRDLAGLRRADLYLYAASRRGIARGIAQQIGQRPAQQSRIDLGLRIALHPHLQISLLQRGLVILHHFVR